MELIVVHLIEGTTPEKSPRDISACLSNFMREMSVNHLSDAIQKIKESNHHKEKGKSESSEIDGYLRSIWTTLLNCASHSSSSVRVSAYSATWSFLMKTMPTYPILMRNSFSDVVDHFSGESNVSILLISSFAFISHFVSPNKVEDFLDRTPLFHHFIAKESIYSEHLSNIISNLSTTLSNEWYKNLLLAFIKLCKVPPSSSAPTRHVFKAIAALIKKNQKLLLPEILVQDENDVFPGQLSLISFILSSPISSISLNESFTNSKDENSVNLDSIDLKKTAIAAFESLKNSRNSTMIEVDDALSILSLRSKSFRVTVTSVNENDEDKESKNELKFLISLEDHGSFIFDDQKSIQRPLFYLLPLPKSCLIPNTETDSSSIIGIKLKTIGLLISDCNMIVDVEDEINMIDELCSTEAYNDNVSYCLQCLSLCVNTLILNAKSHKLSRLLRKLLFEKTISWFHAFNILTVIKAIRIELISIVLGPSGFRDIIKTVVSFCMNQNQDLSRSSFETLIILTSDETFYEVTNYIAKDIDFFNSFSLQKHLLMLAGLIPLHANIDRSHLNWLFYAIIENINDHIFDIDASAAIFQFFSFFKLSKLPDEVILPISKIAQMILKLAMDIYRNGTARSSSLNQTTSIGSLESMSNSTALLMSQESLLASYNTNKESIRLTLYEIMRNYMDSKKIEIVSPKSYDYQIHFIHIYSVMKFLFSLKPSTFRSQKMNKVLLWCFRMFPIDCSFYFASRLKYFANEQKVKIIKYSYPYLEAVPDVKVYAIWCEIAMLHLKLDDHEFKEFWMTFIRSMFESVRFYATKQKEKKISLNSIVQFSYFLGFIKRNYKEFSINIDHLSKKLFGSKHSEKEEIFPEYIRMFLSKLSDIKKIQFIQIVEKDSTFTSDFPIIIYEITAQYTIPKKGEFIKESFSKFKNLIDAQKDLILNDFCKPSYKLPDVIPDVVIEYARSKMNGWKLLYFYRKLIKTKISSDLLTEIKLELNVEPRAFNPVCQKRLEMRDPQKSLQFYSNINSIIRIKTVFCLIKEALDKDPNLIDFSSISFTQSMIPYVAKFIKEVKDKQKVNHFIKAEEKLQLEMPLLKYFFNPDLEFKLESNQRKLTKALIYRICRFMQEFNMTINKIDIEIIYWLKETHSFNRIKALLTLASVHLSMLKNKGILDETGIAVFVESIFEIMKMKADEKHDDIIPQKELLNFALSVNHLNYKSLLEIYISFIDHYCKLYVFPDCLTLHLKNSPRIKFEESLNDIIMFSNHPSFILQSIRALRCIVAVGDISAIKIHIEDYITKFHQLEKVYPVSYYVSYFLFDLVSFQASNNNANEQPSVLSPSFSMANDQANFISDDTLSVAHLSDASNSMNKMNSSPNLILSIAVDQIYVSIRKSIMSDLFSNILVPISRASFYPLAKIIIALINSETNSKKSAYTKLVCECEKIIEDGISSFLLFKLYLEILSSRIRKIPDKSTHSLVARDSVISLINIFKNGVNLRNILAVKDKNIKAVDSSVSTFDSYFINDYLNAILKLMNEFMPFDEMVDHFIKIVLPAVPRFFPVFVAIAKILKHVLLNDEKQSEKVGRWVKEVKLLLDDKQSKALDLILEGPMTNEILNLSIGTVKPLE